MRRCDLCGRYVDPVALGVSWRVDFGKYGELQQYYRCSPCTDEYGVQPSDPAGNGLPFYGRNGERAR
jgi:hypothetical protein